MPNYFENIKLAQEDMHNRFAFSECIFDNKASFTLAFLKAQEQALHDLEARMHAIRNQTAETFLYYLKDNAPATYSTLFSR